MTMDQLKRSVCVLACLATAACGDDVQGGDDSGPDGDGDADTDTDSDTDADTDADADADTDTETVEGPGASLVGKWAQLVNVTIIQNGIPIVNEQWVGSRNWYLVNLVSDGEGNLTAHETLCAIRLKLRGMNGLNLGNQSIVPQNFVDHVKVLERHVTVDSDAPGTPWVSDIVYEVRGANLCNGECDPFLDQGCDPLPANGSASSASDAPSCSGACNGAQCDQDQDGLAGMTNSLVGALNCEIYASQRWWARFNGEIVDADTIAGPITDNFSEQTVLAASSFTCELGNPGTASENCPPHQYFKMVRLPGNATCADVMALTDCDEDPANCDTNTVQPLDPRNDLPTDDCD
jgi:hypothetical protein